MLNNNLFLLGLCLFATHALATDTSSSLFASMKEKMQLQSEKLSLQVESMKVEAIQSLNSMSAKNLEAISSVASFNNEYTTLKSAFSYEDFYISYGFIYGDSQCSSNNFKTESGMFMEGCMKNESYSVGFYFTTDASVTYINGDFFSSSDCIGTPLMTMTMLNFSTCYDFFGIMSIAVDCQYGEPWSLLDFGEK